jgi:hypothetical protein
MQIGLFVRMGIIYLTEKDKDKKDFYIFFIILSLIYEFCLILFNFQNV